MLRRIVLAVLMLATATEAEAQGIPGEVRCTIAGGFGFIVASSRAITCIYYRPDGAVEFYTGSMTRAGLDAGPANARNVAYRVTTDRPDVPGALQGDFGGVGVGITAGEGLAADALTGGQGVTLLPIANSDLTGINVYGGIGAMHLDYAGSEPGRLRRYRR